MTQALLARPLALLDLALDRLATLGRALGYNAEEMRTAASIFERLAVPWGEHSLAGGPPFGSDITDDHTPFEFSLAIDGATPELRFLTEAQAEQPDISSNWAAALALNEELARHFAIDLGRLAVVEDLFAPSGHCPRFALWHAVCLPRGRAPEFKIYLNPQAHGKTHASEVVREALARLGFGAASLPVLGPEDELCYFSLDLSAAPRARVKIYIAHQRATLARIEAAVSVACDYQPGRATAFCQAMSDARSSFEARPVLTCLSFVSGNTRATSATVHFPVRSYAANDQVVKERLRSYLSEPSALLYEQAIEAFAHRPLADHSGIQTYVSLRLQRERDRVTVYLAPELYTARTRRLSRPPLLHAVTPAEDAVP